MSGKKVVLSLQRNIDSNINVLIPSVSEATQREKSYLKEHNEFNGIFSRDRNW